MNIKNSFNNFINKSHNKDWKILAKKAIDGTISEEEIIELIVSKKIFKRYKGQKIIDYILKSNIQSDVLDFLATSDLKFAKYYFKHNRFNILGEAEQNILLKRVGPKTILDFIYEKFLNNPNIPDETKQKAYANIFAYKNISEIVEIAYRNNDFKIALNNEDFLLSSPPNTKKGSQNFQTNLDVIIDTLLKSNRITDLTFIVYSGKILTYKSKHLGGKTILEYLADEIKDAIDFSRMTPSCLIHMFDQQNTILDFLIKRCREQVINIFLKQENIIYNTRILQILRANNIKTTDDEKPIILGIPLKSNEQERYECEPDKIKFPHEEELNVSPLERERVEEFRRLMLTKSESDKIVVDLACTAFLQAFANKHPYANRELQFFIDKAQSENPFRLVKTQLDNSDSTSSNKSAIYIANPYCQDSFNHELGHTLHLYYDQFSVPEEYYQLATIDEIKKQKIMHFVTDLYDKINNRRKQITLNYEQLPTDDIDESNQKLEEYFNDYLKAVNQDLQTAAKDNNYPNEYVNYLNNHILTLAEFKEQYKMYIRVLRIETYTHRFYEQHYGALVDIFDALSYGIYGTLGIENNVMLPYYHGIDYYFSNKRGYLKFHPFTEIIADYIAITKSPNRNEMLEILTDIMGKEFVDMLQEYYDNLTPKKKGK